MLGEPSNVPQSSPCQLLWLLQPALSLGEIFLIPKIGQCTLMAQWGRCHFVFGSSPQRFLCHFPNKFASFPICFVSPTKLLHFPNNLSHFPNNLSHFPNNLFHYPNTFSHFPNNLFHYPNTFSHFPNNFVSL